MSDNMDMPDTTCPRCSGEGFVPSDKPYHEDPAPDMECPDCLGTGDLLTAEIKRNAMEEAMTATATATLEPPEVAAAEAPAAPPPAPSALVSPLEFVDPGAKPKTKNSMLYGGPGVGKTVAAGSSPGPVLYVNAEGPTALDYARERFGDDKFHEVEFTTAAQLASIYTRVKDGKNEPTVVLDSLGEIYRVILKELAGGGKPSLPNYGDANDKLYGFCRSLRDAPVNLVLIAHEAPVKDEIIGGFEYLPVTGTSNPKLGVDLMKMVDIVAYCTRVDRAGGTIPDDIAATLEPDKDWFVGQLTNANGRRGKDRTDKLGKFRTLDLTEWLETATTPAKKAGK